VKEQSEIRVENPVGTPDVSAFLTFTVLCPVKHCRDDHAFLHPIDFVDHDVGQSRDHPFKRAWIVTDMTHEGKGNQQFGAANSRSTTVFAVAGLS
jgi:hypothetical protein